MLFSLMAFAVFHSHTFDKSLARMPKDFKEWLDKVECQLAENPYVGDQIRVPWFREKKKGTFRAYYLIYDELRAVYFVGISAKKDQQTVINTIWLLLDHFKEEIQNLVQK
jgi:mRNA-degrading endonuclease RelE of RelBE toxin-antitoxin system